MIVTAAPLSASSVARMTADVDFPAPPLGLAKTIVGMCRTLRLMVDAERKVVQRSDEARKLLDIQTVADSFPVVNGKLPDIRKLSSSYLVAAYLVSDWYQLITAWPPVSCSSVPHRGPASAAS